MFWQQEPAHSQRGPAVQGGRQANTPPIRLPLVHAQQGLGDHWQVITTVFQRLFKFYVTHWSLGWGEDSWKK